MNKKFLTGLIVIILIIAGAGIYLAYKTVKLPGNVNPPVTQFDPLNATYVIDNVPVKLVNGAAEINVVPGSASKTLVATFGTPVLGDLNGDSLGDAAVMLTVDTGGSGTFFYVAADINGANGGLGTNAILLGDRIAPQNIEIKDGKIIANYATRNPGEPMTTQPSLGVSDYFTYNGSVLTKVSAPPQTFSYLTSSADPAKYCNGADMDSVGYQKTITNEQTTTTLETNPTIEQLVKETINAATTGMCKTVLSQANITVKNGVVTIPPIDGWAGVSIAMCSCKPQVEVNLMRVQGITKVDWGGSNVEASADKSNLIVVNTPKPNQKITSPLTIEGQARGSWFFEASFPVFLTDWDGKIIAQGVAHAKGEWMTSNFVPFSATLTYTFPKTSYSNSGTLILKKDNPSGLPQNDDALEIPVVLSGATIILPTPKPPVVCTMEAKLCPDGTYVGRTGPNCEFSPCPGK